MTTVADSSNWQPAARNLVLRDGMWRARKSSAISYPQAANDAFHDIEGESFWFRHRLDCFTTVLEEFPPDGDFYDIGGGNGTMATELERRGWSTVLVEPGSGASNAQRRGLKRIVQATLSDADFLSESMPAAGCFDVIEHIADDLEFIRSVRRNLKPAGRFYCTVPALPALWSEEDISAGHFRRYTEHSLAHVVRTAGFEVDFITPFFSWLVVPVFVLRSLPSLLHQQKSGAKQAAWSKSTTNDHRLPSLLAPLVAPIHKWELRRLSCSRPLPTGTSLLCVARNRSP